MKLDNRLKCIAGFVAHGASIADIGTDHAYLSVFLMREGIAVSAVAADIADGPLQAASATITKAGFDSIIKIKKGNGLMALSEGDADTVIIAGMGAGTIKQILIEGSQALTGVSRLILQPMGDAALLRGFLYKNGWQITKEALVEESGRIYQIIAAQKAKENLIVPDDFSLVAGELILQEKSLLLAKHLENIIAKYKLICANMQKSAEAMQKPEYKKYLNIIEKAEEFLKCL